MSPGDPALAMPIPAPFDDAVPDYVQALERAADYLPEAQRALLRRAWAVGAAAHAGQMRKSGEPYITHPVAVAAPLAATGSGLVAACEVSAGELAGRTRTGTKLRCGRMPSSARRAFSASSRVL